MWRKILERLKSRPERLSVVRVLLENGLSVKNGKVYLGDITIPIVEVGRAARVDRRTVSKTIEIIEGDPELQVVFAGLKPAGASLRDVAKHLGLSVVEITPTDPKIPGILAGSAALIAERGISIRQAIVDDPELSPEPKLVLIVDGRIPGDLISEILKIKGVSKVLVY